jgi:hypothetical protein
MDVMTNHQAKLTKDASPVAGRSSPET